MGRRVWRHRQAERDGHRIREALRKLPKKAVPVEAEDAAPDPVEMNGDDRRDPALRNALEPPTEWEKGSGPGNLPLGKNADEVPPVESSAGLTQRAQNDPEPTVGGDGNDTE